MNDQISSKSVISSEVEITGQVKSSGSIEINGKLDGELTSGGDVTVGKTAQIKGNVTINSITVSGSINGNIFAKDRVEMKSSAKVMGDVKAKRMEMEDGVIFVGKSEVNPSGSSVPVSSSRMPVNNEGDSNEEDKAKTTIFSKK